MIVGTAALVAVVAVLTLAVATMVRRSAAAVMIVIAAIVVPYFLSAIATLPAGIADWLLRVTPAAAFAVQQATPQYPQVQRLLRAGVRLLPARAVGRVRGAVRLDRGRARPGPPTCCAGGTHSLAPSAGGSGRPETLHAEWTKLRTLPSTGWLLLAAVALTVAVERGGGRAVDLRVAAAARPTRPSSASPASRSARRSSRSSPCWRSATSTAPA